MRPMGKSIIRVLSLSLIVFCLACEHQSQTSVDSKTSQNTASVTQEDLTNWQTVLLREKGIRFRLPPDWHHNEPDFESKNENVDTELLEWNTPNKEMIRILKNTFHKGFVSAAGKSASKEELLEEEFNDTPSTETGFSVSEVKKIRLGKVEGVFRLLQIDFNDKEIGVRRGITWRGFRNYQGKGEKIEINISANPKSEALLRAIFSTIEMEQDK